MINSQDYLFNPTVEKVTLSHAEVAAKRLSVKLHSLRLPTRSHSRLVKYWSLIASEAAPLELSPHPSSGSSITSNNGQITKRCPKDWLGFITEGVPSCCESPGFQRLDVHKPNNLPLYPHKGWIKVRITGEVWEDFVLVLGGYTPAWAWPEFAG